MGPETAVPPPAPQAFVDLVRTVMPAARKYMKQAIPRVDRSALRMAHGEDILVPGAVEPLPARLYTPVGFEPGAPLIVFFHGGGFVVCDLDTHDGLCRRLAMAAGARVLSVHYRLAPEHPFPAQRDDAFAAVTWALQQAEALDCDPERVAVAGDSAGAYLAAVSALNFNREQPGAIAAQILIYPLAHTDDALWSAASIKHARIIGRAAVAIIRAALETAEDRFESLLDEDFEAAPPTLLCAGGLDPCRTDADELAERLQEIGALVSYRTYPLLTHGGANVANYSPVGRKAIRELGAAARALLNGEPQPPAPPSSETLEPRIKLFGLPLFSGEPAAEAEPA